MIDLFRASPHVAQQRGQTFVVKLGGAPLANRAHRRALAKELALVHALGARLVVVHGGGPQTDAVQRLLGEEPRMVGGRRITTPVALRALCMATAGELALELTSELVAAGLPAVGLPGASAGLLLAVRRPPVSGLPTNGSAHGSVNGAAKTPAAEGPIDFGAVGDLVAVDPRAVRALLDAGLVPVIAPPASDGRGNLLNVNADLAAAELAVALGAAKLVLVTSAPGILTDPADPATLVSAIALEELGELEHDGRLQGGMQVKAQAIRSALERGVGRVHVVSGLDPEALLVELYTNQGAGTLVTREREAAPEPLVETAR